MDEVLRRRLVGATVLLAFAFGVASLLPDPAPRAPSSSRPAVTYDLRTGEPVGMAAAPETQPEPEAQADAESAAEPEQASPPRPALKVDDTLGGPGAWYLQIGSFGNQSNATGVLQKLYNAGLPARIDMPRIDKKLWYRVRVGPYADEAAAQQALAEVRKLGYPLAKVVRPEPAAAGGG